MAMQKYTPVKGASHQVIDVDTDLLYKVSTNCSNVKCSKKAGSYSAEKLATTYISSLFSSIDSNISGAQSLSQAVSNLKTRIESIRNP